MMLDALSYFSEFSRFIGSNRQIDFEAALRHVGGLLEKSRLVKILEECEKNIGVWPCDSSYSHNNGFTKLSILKIGLIHVRLHVWEGREFSTIHNHDWDFISIGIKGLIEFTNYYENPLGSGYRKTLLKERRDRDTGDILAKISEDVGGVDLGLNSVYTLSAFAFHAIRSWVPHRSKMLTEDAVSLVITGPSVRHESAIYEIEQVPRSNNYMPLSVAEKKLAILKILDGL